MKVIEVRDGFIKIEADESIYLSSFVRIEGEEKDYIAQISNLKKINGIAYAIAKILFIMKGDELYNYDKTEPSEYAKVIPFTLDLLQNSINVNKPVIVGKTYNNTGNIVVDLSVFNKKMLISVNSNEMNNVFVKNLSKQFLNLGKNTVVIDTHNVVKLDKIYAGKDFKLPLNKLTLQFLYKVCISEATQDSKPLIGEVFRDLSEYCDSVEFVPFNVLKSIVDDMVDKQHVFKLFVLKNKLRYLEKAGYFADTIDDLGNIKEYLDSEYSVIDISSSDSTFLNCFLEYVYSLISPDKTQVLLEMSNNISKHILKKIVTELQIPSVFIVNPKYRYLNDMKSLFDNFIIEPSPENNAIFSVYSSFLTSMPDSSYLIAGEGLNYIPVISKSQIINEVLNPADYVVQETLDSAGSVNEVVNDISNEGTYDTGDDTVIETADTYKTDSVEEDNVEEDNVEEDDIQTTDKILADIEQKSDDIIDSLSENTEDIQEVDLFDSDEQEYESADANEDIINAKEESLITEVSDVQDEIIEPEYTELPNMEEQNLSVETPDVINELKENEITEDVLEMEPVETIAEDENYDEIVNDDVSLENLNDLTLTNDVSGDLDLVQDIKEEISDISDDGENIIEDTADILDSLDENETDLLNENAELINDAETMQVSSENPGEKEEYPQDNEELNEELSLDNNSDDSIDDLEELVELDPNDADGDDIIIDISEDENENLAVDEELEQQLVEDVDKVYTTIKESDEIEEISDSDLDLIDELNSDGEELLEEYSGSIDDDMLEPPTESIIPERQPSNNNPEILEKKDSNTPIVPVYDADIPQEDLVISDPIQQGDSVVHAKYGNGVVEKMIKYGTKTLFSINFENIGRRLLDPTLTEIKKV